MNKKLTLMLLGMLMTITAWAQQAITGTVIAEEDGQPVIGAAVKVKGSTKGVVTDMDGKFSINVKPGATLEFSYVGMQTKEATAKNGMKVKMSNDDTSLDEVVVTAQGLTRKDKSIGYAAQKVSAEDLTTARQLDLGNAMAGKVSGARFIGGSGSTFDAGTIVLRGTTDFSNPMGNEPIYVVDGAITDKNSVNMDDVESINVLKGSAATALYGSQGGNGAIIVTTKKADSGKAHFEVSHTIQFESFKNNFNLQKEYGGGSYGMYGERYADEGVDNMSADYLFNKLYKNEGTNPYKTGIYRTDDGIWVIDNASDESWGARFDNSTLYATPNYFDSESSQYGKASTWSNRLNLNDLYQTGVSNTTNVAFSKAGEGYSTRISFTNAQRDGIVQNSEATRRFLSIRSSFDVTKWLTVSADYKFTYRRNQNAATEGYSTVGNVLYDFVQWGQTNVNIADYKNYKRSDGSWTTWNSIGWDGDYYELGANYHDNPYAIMNEITSTSTNYWHVFTADAEIKLPLKIKAGVKVTGSILSATDEDKYASGSINYTPYYSQRQYNKSDITVQGRLTWGDHFLNDKLSVDAAAFIEQRQYGYKRLFGSTTSGLIADGYYNLAGSYGNVAATNYEENYKTRAIYGTATVGYDDTYFLDASIRGDWDSRLSSDKNHYVYGGLSASVMLNKFIKAKWLNYWKIRASFAQVGSTLDPYELSDVYYTYKYNLATSKTGLYRSETQINYNIEPTISTSYEVGTEFKMFGNRLYGDLNFYTKDTKNQILDMTTTAASGYTSKMINAGLIRNRGVEFSIGGVPVKTKDWQWNIDFNLAKNWNTLVSLSDDMSEYTLYWNSFYYEWSLKAIEGRPIGVITTDYRWARNENGQLILSPTTSSAWGGGYAPTYDDAEKEVGNFQPDVTGGFSTSLRWKNLTLAMNFDFMIGGQMVSWTNMWGTGSGLLANTSVLNDRGVNVREAICNGGGVKVDGVDTDGNPVSCYMNAYYYYHYKAYFDLDEWVYDRTYLKMRELSLTYQCPKSWINYVNKFNLGLTSASFSFVATNPWLMYSACPNVDPSEMTVDTSSTSSMLETSYIEGGQAPSTKSFGFTVKLGF